MLLLFFGTTALVAQDTKMKASANNAGNDKAYLLAYFDKTTADLKKSIAGLTPAQLKFKPAADRWSISQCLEHIVLTEKALFDYARKGMDTAANPGRRNEVKTSDENIIKGMEDRSHKVKTTTELTGTGKYQKADDALADLAASRKLVLTYLDTKTLDDLRNHISDSPFGAVDGFQSFLFLAGHTARHNAQINEVKADPKFPVK